MHRDLVEESKWITNDDYKTGFALSQLAPGPLAAQLSIYIGYIHYRIWGATLAGVAFVLPSFIMVLALGYFYNAAGELPWLRAVFYGVGSCVIGIIACSSLRLIKKNVGNDFSLWLIFLFLAGTTFFTERENAWLILAAGFFVWLLKHPPKRRAKLHSVFLLPILLQVTGKIMLENKLAEIGWFFLKAGAFVFGSGLAIVPFLYGGVVKEYQWLNEQQFLDAVAVAMITPGPVVITVGFIGYLVAGVPGACVAALATFLPCYLFTIIPAPYFKKYGAHPAIRAFVDGITAAAIGAIAGAVCILAKRQLSDMTSVIIALVSFLVLFNYKKIKEPVLILIAAAAGILLKSL
jgi:chromate transporter